MKNTTITIILGLLLISVASAIYSGETIYTDLQNEVENLQSFECNLTAENYNLNGSNFTMNDTGYILSLDLNFRPDNLTISCLLNGEKWVEDNVASSGGNGYGGGCYTKYECTEWSGCNNGTMQRSCARLRETCQGLKPFPEIIKSCDVGGETPDFIDDKNETDNQDIIDQSNKGYVNNTFTTIVLIALIVGGAIYFIRKFRKDKRGNKILSTYEGVEYKEDKK